MSLLELHHDSALTAQEAPSGEDYAKGSSHLVWASLIAFVVVSVGIALFLLANHKPPVSAGEVTQVWVHGVHTLDSPKDANGVPISSRPFDQILVFGHVRVRNQSDQPIVLREMMTNVTLDDGPHSSYAATATDYSRIFLAYPELAGLRSQPLVRDTVIQPGQVLDGMIVSAFHASKEQWDAHKDLSFTLQFKFHPDLVLTPTAQQVLEQQ